MGGNRLNGILIIDKPKGMSSAKVVAYVKNKLGVKKVGHAGTLDPFATGVLICCINDATKLSRFFLHDKKKYYAILKLGTETDTQDSTGNMISVCDQVEVTDHAITEVFKRYHGLIEQIPPSFSALKHKGVPLYKHARRGKIIKKPARQVQIYNLKVCKIDLPLIHFEVTCSGGTYIRTLGADIGKHLGCGACLEELCRLESSGFKVDDAITLSEMDHAVSSGNIENRIISMTDALKGVPSIDADDNLTDKIKHGMRLNKKELKLSSTEQSEGFIKVLNKYHELIAILSYDQARNEIKYCNVFTK